MPQAEADTVTIDKAELIELLTPALDTLWAMHLDIPQHPACPMRPAAEKGINGLTMLLHKAKGLTDGL